MKKVWPIPNLFSLETAKSPLFVIFVVTVLIFISGISFGEVGSLAIFTSLFLHSSLLILAFNMFFFVIWGRRVQNAFGPIRFMVIYFLSGIIANFVFVSSFPTELHLLTAIGSAGAIAGVLGSYVFLNDRNYHNSQNLRPEDMFYVLLWSFVQFFYLGDTGQIAIAASAVGFVTGMILSLVFFLSNPEVNIKIEGQNY